MYWINLAEDRDQWRFLVNSVMDLRLLWSVGKYLSSWATGGFSRRTQLNEVGYKYVYNATFCFHVQVFFTYYNLTESSYVSTCIENTRKTSAIIYRRFPTFRYGNYLCVLLN
jgi:hypothetical protein